MTPKELIHEALLGGPGLDGYAFNADLLCTDCAEKWIRDNAERLAPLIQDTDDPLFSDSGTLPQPIFFGERTTTQHCGECGLYLFGEDEEEEDEELP